VPVNVTLFVTFLSFIGKSIYLVFRALLLRDYNSGLHWVRRPLSSGGTLFPQPDYSGAGALRLGVAQFPVAAAIEKDQRDSLSTIAHACACFGRTIRSDCRAYARLDRGAKSHRGYGAGINLSQPSHSPHGGSLRHRLRRGNREPRTVNREPRTRNREL
jgi:hypothetical protein